MPHGIHTKTARTYRPDPELYARAQVGVASVGSTMNEHISAFLKWLVHDTDELPARPDREDIPKVAGS
jgi:hypothetical protein